MRKKNMPDFLIRRSDIFNFLPQEPAWFCNAGHHRARARYKRKLRSEYQLETLDACPLCGRKEMSPIAMQERHGLPVSVMLCENCALAFNNPRPDSAALSDHYRRDYREIERGIVGNIHEFMFDLQEAKAPGIWTTIKEHARPTSTLKSLRIAEIGCGEGGIVGWLARNVDGVHATGFELNADAVSYGKSKGLDLRYEIFRGGEAFDVIILEQVLEHLSDVSGFLKIASKAQKHGDLLYIGVPGLLDAAAHYNSNFISYLEYGHLSHFCLHTLERAVAPHGYELVYGDETIRSLFRRVEDASVALSSKPVSAEQLKNYLLATESEFQTRANHVLTNWRPYAKYILTYLLSYL
ncbi:MAG TPA: methyltransferase domain-containing protein [Rhizomicrobium sp.]|jgi:SAM-dependent methyltransferase|nr:methyltransferase domain-containing protein [Rhizomicrobium sp.]